MVFPIYLGFISQHEKYGLQSCWLGRGPSPECSRSVVPNLGDKDLLDPLASEGIMYPSRTIISAVSPVIGDPVLRNRCIR